MQLVFLGTSCAIPTRQRALPATALVYEGAILLFDCGEGTQRQLLLSGLKITRVRYVFISHLHADHCLGLPGLIVSRSFVGARDPLDVYGPPGAGAFVESSLRLTGSHVEYDLRVHETEGGTLIEEANFRVVAEPLKHRDLCLGFAFVERDRPGRFDVERAKRLGIPPGPIYGELKAGGQVTLPDGRVVRGEDLLGPPIPGRRVAYAVDTAPCPGTYHLAEGADVLIHDSTLAPGNEEESREYGHSTSLQAFKIARRSGVRKLVLAHFSPRYENAEVFLEDLPKEEGPEVVLAEDLGRLEIPRRKPAPD